MAKSGKKLAVAIVVLVVAVALATTATFAWFTMNQSVSVGNFDMNVTSNDGGLYISLDGTNFSTSLKPEDVKKIIWKNAGIVGVDGQADTTKKFPLNNVTSKKIVKGSVIEGSNPEQTEPANVFSIVNEDGATAAEAGAYAQFDVYFRATEAVNVYLDLNTKTGTEPDQKFVSRVDAAATIPAEVEKHQILAWKDIKLVGDTGVNEYGTTDEYSIGDKIIARAANASRIGFTAFNVTNLKDTGASLPDYEQGATAVWNPNADQGFKTGNLAGEYRQTLAGVAVPTEKKGDILNRSYADALITLSAAKASESEPAAGKEKYTSAYYEGKLTLTIWLEGTDGDCFNSVLEDAFSVFMSFTSKAPTAAA